MLRAAYDATWGRLFALGYERFMERSEAAGMREIRRAALAQASGRVLEIGAGTGLNVALYPPAVTELVLSEPFQPMAARIRSKRTAHGAPVEVVVAAGEALPLPDDSFDTVVVTLVLCTAPDPAAVLAQAARVLRPGGRLLFVEHVRSPDPALARWQDRLHGPWWVFGHGCHCNRDTLATLEASPLAVEQARRGSIPKAPPIVRPLLHGAARKPA